MNKETNDNTYSHILKCISVFGGVQGLNILVGLVRNKLVAILLGPSGMGLISLFNSTLKLVSDTTNLGISTSAVKELSDVYSEEDNIQLLHRIGVIRTWSLLTALLGLCLCALCSPFLDEMTFPERNHAVDFLCLSPVVAFTAVMGGELAILKSTRKLKPLAKLSVYSVIASLLISVPLYYVWRDAAIVPSLVLVALAQLLVTLYYSFRLFPLDLSKCWQTLLEGKAMVRLGLAFVLAGMLTSGSEYLVRSYLNHYADLAMVGLYNSSYAITIVYAGMIFQAMDTDYFPRLSSVGAVGEGLNGVVNSQVEVTILLLSPMLVLFISFVPIILPLLYSRDFVPAEGLMRISVLAMYFRAFSLPIEYIPLSRGDSKIFLFSELFGAICMVFFVIGSYQVGNLLPVSLASSRTELTLSAMGVGLAVYGFVNLLFELGYSKMLYGYRPSRQVIIYMFCQIPLGVLACVLSFMLSDVWAVAVDVLVIVLSLMFSYAILRKKTNLWAKFSGKMSLDNH